VAASDPRILEWYRVDAWPRMRRVLIAGPVLLSLGGLVVAVSFAARQPPGIRAVAAALGMALVATGAGSTLLGMQRILRDDAYLAIRTDGVAFRGTGAESAEAFVAWDALARAAWEEPRGALVLERKDAAPLTLALRFAGIGGAALAEAIERARRRAAMGMLRPE
jgi:hypothetical protein